MRLVLDKNVLVSGLRSADGASFRVLRQIGSPLLEPIVSTSLCLEYEDVLKWPHVLPEHTLEDINDFLDYLVIESTECRVYFQWRPHLLDPKDDMVLELALVGAAPFIVTHNVRHFRAAISLGIQAMTPARFLSIIREV